MAMGLPEIAGFRASVSIGQPRSSPQKHVRQDARDSLSCNSEASAIRSLEETSAFSPERSLISRVKREFATPVRNSGSPRKHSRVVALSGIGGASPSRRKSLGSPVKSARSRRLSPLKVGRQAALCSETTPQQNRRSWNDNDLFSVEAKQARQRKSSLRRQQRHSNASKADMMSNFASCRNFDLASLDPTLVRLLGADTELLQRDAASIANFYEQRFELEQQSLSLAHELLAKDSPFLRDPTLLELGLGDGGLRRAIRQHSPPATPVQVEDQEKSSPLPHRGSARRSSTVGPKTGLPGRDSGHSGFDSVRRTLVLEPLAK